MNKGRYKFLIHALIIVILPIIIELFVFNFRHFESLFFGIEQNIDYYTNEKLLCTKGSCVTLSEDDAYLELKNIGSKVYNIYLDFKSEKNNLITDIDVYYTDDANKLYNYGGKRTYVETLERSHYLKLETSGKSEKIKIVFNKQYLNFNIDTIKINTKVPIDFNIIRVLIILIIIMIIFSLSSNSPLMKIHFDEKISKVIIIYFGIALAFIAGIGAKQNYYLNSIEDHIFQSPYKKLAESFTKGKLYIDIPVNEKLAEMENPYDTNYRYELIKNDYIWDYAFYNGKYYIYFGVLPCLLIYLPHYIIFGTHIANTTASVIVSAIYIFSVLVFIYQLCKKYFKNMLLPIYLLLSCFIIFSSGIVIFLSQANTYGIPIVMGLSCIYFGLSFWLIQTNNNKHRTLNLLLGSLFIALTSCTRPQLLISIVFAIPLFYDDVFKNRTLFSKESKKETIAFIVPFIVIALLVMLYNYSRFSSPFDFGASYNLTTNDMTHRGFKFDRIFLGLYSYLFETTKINTIFPFIIDYDIQTSYLGTTISEKMYGGFFFANMICLLSLIPFEFKKIINEKTLYKFTLISLISTIVLIIFDTEMAGILNRYFLDFSWLLTLSTTIIIASILTKYNNKTIKRLIFTFIFMAIIYNIFSYFTNDLLYLNNDLLFQKLKYFFMFWL